MINRRGFVVLIIVIFAWITGALMKQPIAISYIDPMHVHAREEQIHSLVDGRARHPDGRIREIGVPLYERMREKARLAEMPDADIIAERVAVGASSPLGRRYSMVVEQKKNDVSTEQTEWEIEQLKRDEGAYQHEHHAAYMR